MEPTAQLRQLERQSFRLAVTAATAVIGVFGYPLLTGEVYTVGDLASIHIPFRHFYDSCLANGDSFLWYPFTYNGFYAHGEGQGAFYHPLNYFTYAALPFAPAFTIEILRNYVFAFVGFFLFARRWPLDRGASAFGATLFAFCTFQFTHYMHVNFVGIASQVPWGLWAVDLAARGPTSRHRNLGALALAAVTGSQLLLSHPQVTWMSLLAEGLYTVFLVSRGVFGRSPAGDPKAGNRSAVSTLCVLALSIALGFALAGIQLLPMWDALQVSFRAAPPEGFAGSYAIHPLNLAQIVAPYLFLFRSVGFPPSANALYLGAAVPPLLVWLALRGRNVGRLFPLAMSALALAALGLLLALGDIGVVARGLEFLPVVGLFRAPGRYALLLQLGAAIAAAIAFADLVRVAAGTEPLPRRLWLLGSVPLLSIAATLVVLVLPNPQPDSIYFGLSTPGWIVLGPLLLAIATLLVVYAARGTAVAAIGLLCLSAADLGYYGLSYAWRVPPVEVDPWIARLPGADVPNGFRIDAGHTALGTRGVRQSFGYAAMIPNRVLPAGRLREPGAKADASLIASWRVASVAHAYGKPVDGALPRARLVSSAVVSGDVVADIAAVDVEKVALVAEDPGSLVGPNGSANIRRERPGEIDFEVETPGRQLLVVAETYHEGWRARVDGEACRVIPVYGDFMGCIVPAGATTVTFRFEPESFRLGKNVTIAAVVIAVGLLGATLWRA